MVALAVRLLRMWRKGITKAVEPGREAVRANVAAPMREMCGSEGVGVVRASWVGVTEPLGWGAMGWQLGGWDGWAMLAGFLGWDWADSGLENSDGWTGITGAGDWDWVDSRLEGMVEGVMVTELVTELTDWIEAGLELDDWVGS
jgi:hypothetical protein